jgi:WD40 repeat protein
MQGAHGVAFSPDGRRLATGGGSSRDTVKLWDLSTHRELMTLPGQGSEFSFVVFSPDGRWLAACSRLEGKLHLWRAPSWQEIEAAEQRPESGPSP